jgi:Insertion element 4 transposase N-terminal
MVYFAVALALFAEEDYEETWVRLSETLADWGLLGPVAGHGDDGRADAGAAAARA